MSTIKAIAHRIALSRPLLIRGIFVMVFLSGLASADSADSNISAPTCKHVISAGSEAHVRIRNYMGSIEVHSGDRDKIQIIADVADECVRIDKNSNMILVNAVKEKGIRPINFVVSLPPNCALSLECFNCRVSVRDLHGDIDVQTHDGDIELSNIHSNQVKANSIEGRIVFDGDILTGGTYTFDSINSIDLFLPKESSFDLTTTSEREHVDLGGFGLIDSKTGGRIAGKHGDGGAKVEVTSQGTIHFHRR